MWAFSRGWGAVGAVSVGREGMVSRGGDRESWWRGEKFEFAGTHTHPTPGGGSQPPRGCNCIRN
eukprot:3042078-Prymnesium_polylepis.1